MHPGNLQARVLKFRGQMRFGLLIGRQYVVSLGGLRRTRAVWYCGSGAVVAHGLLWNHNETEISHSPTVSRWFCPVAHVAGMNFAHNWHIMLLRAHSFVVGRNACFNS